MSAARLRRFRTEFDIAKTGGGLTEATNLLCYMNSGDIEMNVPRD